ncbi:unnamed protein product, partial [Prorocentrum cordatum]
ASGAPPPPEGPARRWAAGVTLGDARVQGRGARLGGGPTDRHHGRRLSVAPRPRGSRVGRASSRAGWLAGRTGELARGWGAMSAGGQCQQGALGAQLGLRGTATGTRALKRGAALSRSAPGLALGVPWSEVREAYLQQLTWPGGAAPREFPSRKAVFAQLSAARKSRLTRLDGEFAAATAVGSAAADDASAESTVGTLIAQNTTRSLSTLAALRSELDANLEESLQGSVPWPSKLASRPAPPCPARTPAAETEEPWAPPWEPCEPSWEPPLGSTSSGTLDLSTWSSGGCGATIRLQASRASTPSDPGLGTQGRPPSAALEPLESTGEAGQECRAEAQAAPGACTAADGGRSRRHAGSRHGQ